MAITVAPHRRSARSKAPRQHWPAPNFARPSRAPSPAMACALLVAVVALLAMGAQCWGAWQSLQTAQAAQTQAERALQAARNQRRAPTPSQLPQAQTAVAEAHKLLRGLHPAWTGFVVPLESVGSSELQWLALDVVADSGAVRLSGVARGMEPVLTAIERLSHARGWSQATITRLQANNSLDPSGPLVFELQAQYDPEVSP